MRSAQNRVRNYSTTIIPILLKMSQMETPQLFIMVERKNYLKNY